MIAYHFPPLAGSSGIQRSLRFAQQLPEFGWEPLVLTAHACAYERTSADLVHEVPPTLVVRRAFALDCARHLSIGGRYPGFLARPDRWVSWQLDGVRQGLKLLRKFRPQAIWSTYPIATAHLIAARLQRISRLPWIADFRDPMAQDGYPADERTWRSFAGVERRVFAAATHSLFTTPGAARMYRERFPEAGERIGVLENGYDEESFLKAAQGLDRGPLHPGSVTLLHSGIVYPEERDPSALFAALGRLRSTGRLAAGSVKLRFRAAVHHELLAGLARQHDVEAMVEVCPAIGYAQALQEMLRADGLLVMQGANCNEQIPAKVYEYLRARRPILCLADPGGDTAAVLQACGVGDVAPLESSGAIERLLPDFVSRVRAGKVARPHEQAVADASRRRRTAALAALLDRCVAGARPGAR